jgi:hypothetical protein
VTLDAHFAHPVRERGESAHPIPLVDPDASRWFAAHARSRERLDRSLRYPAPRLNTTGVFVVRNIDCVTIHNDATLSASVSLSVSLTTRLAEVFTSVLDAHIVRHARCSRWRASTPRSTVTLHRYAPALQVVTTIGPHRTSAGSMDQTWRCGVCASVASAFDASAGQRINMAIVAHRRQVMPGAAAVEACADAAIETGTCHASGAWDVCGALANDIGESASGGTTSRNAAPLRSRCLITRSASVLAQGTQPLGNVSANGSSRDGLARPMASPHGRALAHPSGSRLAGEQHPRESHPASDLDVTRSCRTHWHHGREICLHRAGHATCAHGKRRAPRAPGDAEDKRAREPGRGRSTAAPEAQDLRRAMRRLTLASSL